LLRNIPAGGRHLCGCQFKLQMEAQNARNLISPLASYLAAGSKPRRPKRTGIPFRLKSVYQHLNTLFSFSKLRTAATGLGTIHQPTTVTASDKVCACVPQCNAHYIGHKKTSQLALHHAGWIGPRALLSEAPTFFLLLSPCSKVKGKEKKSKAEKGRPFTPSPVR